MLKIAKTANNINSYHKKQYYYNSARAGMHNVVEALVEKKIIKRILLPGYIGWSPKEGSGIFDSVSEIDGLELVYYKMNKGLQIDIEDLNNKIVDKMTLVLIVNYFGFRDYAISKVVDVIREKGALILEDNAHGFYTYNIKSRIDADFIMFSLHKMFPYSAGGEIIVNTCMDIKLESNVINNIYNPYEYDFLAIAKKRDENFVSLFKKIEKYEKLGYIKSLRSTEDLKTNVPQTYPIEICRGNRNKIYEIMNDRGFGVVSLYHTMIEPLRNEEHKYANELSNRILNLPVHQDVNDQYYDEMISALIDACEKTEDGFNND